MSPEGWLRLLRVPAAVWAASLAGRRWGHRVSGYLGGMPLIGGPITLFLALDHGAGFAARSATLTLAAIAGQAAHLLAFALLPREAAALARPTIPPLEMRLRLACALALAAGIVWGAARFGPVVSGLLLSLPVTGSIMPPFTLTLYGPDAVARLARGFLHGLNGFTAFFLVVALAVQPCGIALAFVLASAAAVATASVAVRISHRTNA